MSRLLAFSCALCWLIAAPAARAADQPATGKGFTYDAMDARDPFVALVRQGRLVAPSAGGSNFSTLTLAGILWDPAGRSVALINDAEVTVGDLLGEYRVEDIRQDAVVLTRDGKTVVLQLTHDEGMQPAGRATGGTRQ